VLDRSADELAETSLSTNRPSRRGDPVLRNLLRTPNLGSARYEYADADVTDQFRAERRPARVPDAVDDSNLLA
jgi:hypothetical protein